MGTLIVIKVKKHDDAEMFDVVSYRFEACIPVENMRNIGSLNFIINGSFYPYPLCWSM